jgi:hypothetical protein
VFIGVRTKPLVEPKRDSENQRSKPAWRQEFLGFLTSKQ